MTKIVILTTFLAVSAWMTGCRGETPQTNTPKKQMPTVRAVQVTKGTISKKLELSGSVIATHTARMGSPAEGPVMNCKIREGDAVQKDQVLLKIGRRKAADAMVEAARESLSREKEELRRVEKLVSGGAIPAEELDIAKLRVSRANAELSNALESAGDYEIRAPWDGLVNKINVTDGYFVSPREMLVEIYNPHSLVIRAAVPEKYAASLKTGTKVDVKLDAWHGRSFVGQIKRIYPYLDERSRTRTFEIALGESVDLAPGMFARLEVALETAKDTVLLPAEAIVSTPKGNAVFLLENERAVRRSVQTGIEDGNIVQIASGIDPGDMVIVAGNSRLKDGTAVKVLKQTKPGQKSKQIVTGGGQK